MAEITHRRSGELMRGVFRLLSAHPEGLPAKTVLEKLVERDRFELSYTTRLNRGVGLYFGLRA